MSLGIADFYRGNTKKYKIIVRDKNTKTPISVDGGTLTVTFKKSLKTLDSEAALQVSVSAVEANPLNPTGIITVILPADKTEIEPGAYFYDFQFTSQSGEVTTIISSKVQVLPDVTRDK